MAIAVRCKSCGHLFRASTSHRGQTAPCTHCAAELLVEGRDVPDFDVFVSYSSKDKQITDVVVASLEAAKLRCWVAPRNIAPGAEWGSAIIDAIANSRLMVLVFSGNSNVSPQVLREVERAVSKGLAITPLRIDETPLSKGMEYFISSSHWLDALTPPMEAHMARLVRQMRSLVEQDYEEIPALVPQPSEGSSDSSSISKSGVEPGASGSVAGVSSAFLSPPRMAGKVPYILGAIAILAVMLVMATVYGPTRRWIAGRLGFTSLATSGAPKNSPAADLAALEALLDRACRGNARDSLPVGAPLQFDTPFTANEKGYALSGTLQIGNSVDNGHPGPNVRATATMGPGFCLEGGNLLVCNGKLDLRGTEEKPCVLIGVTIDCESRGTVRATHTFFKNCTFGKAGIMFLFAGYTSKWTFESCVLSNSNFMRLARITYGINLHRCSFIDCSFRARHWGYSKTEGPDDDGAALARGEWSRINQCDFYRCEIAPSISWCMDKCNCYECKVKVPDTAEVFQSRTNLDVSIGLVSGSDEIIEKLRANTSANGSGKVTYSAVPYLGIANK